ncbi:MAG TPA: hypothetical protein VHA71_12205 [Rhodanobacteraceae bacterium]|nr:hypothetical protein [Rhodanobacteraceae bacterium]
MTARTILNGCPRHRPEIQETIAGLDASTQHGHPRAVAAFADALVALVAPSHGNGNARTGVLTAMREPSKAHRRSVIIAQGC